ncbi:hypothetical protein BGW38_004325 [Lunasporangiospora selenospora]|uniref:ATPase inhibitor, mitochondrial n=1 Tax=Lunasporangiospora selenospora TaxID=979761 RepID=A0A9P6KC79_9FUNG|nr:hypothetical protein BGW38_004325 [Lunasporangiospora selenospora]
MDRSSSNPFGDRGKAAEDLYIRQREAEKAAAAREKAQQEAEKAAASSADKSSK